MRTFILSLLLVCAVGITLAQGPPVVPVDARKKVQTTDGRAIEGRVLNEGVSDLQLITDDNHVVLFRKAGDRYRVVTSQKDWPTYHGDPGGNRYTTLTQITKGNVSKLATRWMFPMPNVTLVETTPVVVDGIMYISSANEAYALDAGSGRQIWHFRRPRTAGIAGNAALGFNRGVAVSGNRVFMLTDNAHMIALDRSTGSLQWETEMADSQAELQRHLRAAGRGQSGDIRNCRWRRRRSRIRCGLRYRHRQGGLAFLDRAQCG